MNVKELRAALEVFDDDMIVMSQISRDRYVPIDFAQANSLESKDDGELEWYEIEDEPDDTIGQVFVVIENGAQ